jgi:hypothetical protein
VVQTIHVHEPAPIPVWVPVTDGVLPDGVFIGGQEPDRPLAVCRAEHADGLHPGKVVGRRCNIGFNGREIEVHTFEVLVDGEGLVWEAARKGEEVVGAFEGGWEGDVPLPVCRAELNRGLHPGKLLEGRCHIGYGGYEHTKTVYDVLVLP